MGQTFQQQLASFPIPRLTTVLRVDFPLDARTSSFEDAARFIVEWWNKKAIGYETSINDQTDDLSFSQSGFQLEFARTSDLFALSMQEPDSAVTGRVWMCDFGLRRTGERSEFAVRVSYRQPQDVVKWPEPRAPRFLPDLLDRVGATDHVVMTSTSQVVDNASMQSFVDLVEAPDRRLPVLAISEDSRFRAVFADANKLARVLAGTAHVRRLDRDVSWRLSENEVWTKDFSTFQGAVRCYNPQFSLKDDKFKHRLWMPERIQRMDAFTRDGFLNAVAGHIFTLVTAQFESMTLLTPSTVRRQKEQQRAQRVEAKLQPVLDVLERAAIRVSSASAATAQKKIVDQPFIDSGALATLELQRQNTDLLARNEMLDARLREIEDELNQERAAKAEAAVKSQEQEDWLTLYRQENERLAEQARLATGDSSQETSEALKPLWSGVSAMLSSMQNVADQFRRLERESALADDLRTELEELRVRERSLYAQIESLNKRAPVMQASADEDTEARREAIIAAAKQLARKNPTLDAYLALLAACYPERIVVLETAAESARQSIHFQKKEKVFELLCKLAIEYWSAIQEGGDTAARNVFGTTIYAPREANALSKDGKERRTFSYQGQRCLMEKHLKIGTADNAADTLRIHFEWFPEERLIVVGHCGPHLAF